MVKRAMIWVAACAVMFAAGWGTVRLSTVGGAGWSLLAVQSATELSEADMAQKDHDRVVSAIGELCDYRPSVSLASNRGATGLGDPNRGARTTFQEAAINYSDELKAQRIKLDHEISADRTRIWRFQMAIVLFGALATIMVGLKPLCEMLGVSFANTAVAACAVIFSAVVTALSSLSAITTSQTDVLHHQRTLAQLQQLHWRIDNDVFAATQICEPSTADLGKIGSWKDRFETITNDAMLSLTQPGDLRSIPTVTADVGKAGSH